MAKCNCVHMEIPDDCFVFGSIASLILIDEKNGKTEGTDVSLSLKIRISNKPREDVDSKASYFLVCVCWWALMVCLLALVLRQAAYCTTHTPKNLNLSEISLA